MAIPPIGAAVAGAGAGTGLGSVTAGLGVASQVKSLLGFGGSTPATSRASSTNFDEKTIIVQPQISFGEFLTGPASNGGAGLPPSRIIPAIFQSPGNNALTTSGGFTSFDMALIAGAGLAIYWFWFRKSR